MRRTNVRELEIWVRAPAVDGRANVAIEQTLSARLEIPRSAVRVVRGEGSRHKIVEIADDNEAALEALGPIDYSN